MIPKKLKAKTIKDILKHAESEYPRESCGVVVMTEKGEKYVKCVNTSTDPTEEFKMCPDSYCDAEELGEVVGIVHSHPDATTRPSNMDIAVMQRNREVQLIVDPESKAIPWHIVSWPEGDYRQVIPQDEIGLLGRPFIHNVWDCWATCEAYYNKYHNIEFPKWHREDRWWEQKETTSFYEENYEKCGFYIVHDPKPGDLIVMQIGRSYHPNHAGVFLGDLDGDFEGRSFYGRNQMLHHMYNKESDVITYGGQWQQRTSMILRHRSIKHD